MKNNVFNIIIRGFYMLFFKFVFVSLKPHARDFVKKIVFFSRLLEYTMSADSSTNLVV